MTKLRLSLAVSEKPVRKKIDLPSAVHHDLTIYAEILSENLDKTAIESAKLIATIVEQFIKSDKTFNGFKRTSPRVKSN